MAGLKRKTFLDAPPPVNYVAGLGRGATGFTTRSDIGPARIAPETLGLPPPGYVPGAGRGGPGAPAGPGGAPGAPSTQKPKDEDEDEPDEYNENTYDEFEGPGGSLFDSSTPYDKDDEEADAVWESIDKVMDSRRREQREARQRAELEKYRRERPKIQQQFADLKKDLAAVTYDDWANIPDIGDRSLKHKKRPERYVPPPDSLLERARQEKEQFNFLDPKQQHYGGFETPGTATSLGTATPFVSPTPLRQDLTQIGEARKKVLHIKLTQMEKDSVTGQTNVDVKGFLTDLKSLKFSSAAEIGDLKRARLLLKSVTTTNPKHAPGWIAAARLENYAGKLVQARKIIQQGCDMCPESEDVWLEASNLNNPANAKIILAKAIQHIPNSVKIWLCAANLETELKSKKKVLRKALEFIPNSVKLWKVAIELEEPDDARIMLSRAVECVPTSVEMWLALAHLETYEKAKEVLNKAIKSLPAEKSIWITAAKLEEVHGDHEMVGVIITRAVKNLAANGVMIEREQWVKEAESCEASGAILTCQTIIKETIGLGVEEEDRKRTWMEDAENSIKNGFIQTARAIYAHALKALPSKKSLWLKAAELEREKGTRESLDSILSTSTKYCPQTEIFWLMRAKEKWMAGNVDEARHIIQDAYIANPNSEQIWLAAVKLESENNEPERARMLLEKARKSSGTARVWMKSAKLERDLKNRVEERKMLEEALAKFPQFDKLWMMKAQHEEATGDKNVAREFYQRGLKNCPNSIPMWKCAAHLEESVAPAKARALLEKARIKNPKNPVLWLEAIRVEIRAGNRTMADNYLAKAFQECPTAGILWAEAIALASPQQQKQKIVDALKKLDNDAHVIVAVAKSFWADRKIDKARSWFKRAVSINPDLGDAWAYSYKFEVQHGDQEQQKEVIQQCVKAGPRHGDNWCKVSKASENYRLNTEMILKKVALSLK